MICTLNGYGIRCKYQYPNNDGRLWCGIWWKGCDKMHMTDQEIIRSYTQAENKNEQVRILSELNLVSKQEMAQWLADHDMWIDKRWLQKGSARKKEESVITEEIVKEPDQAVKADAGKPRLTLVPMQIVFDVAEVREYGNNKYPDGGPDNWKRVEEDRYWEAAFRHFLRCVNDHKAVDPESGIRHFKHLLCNLAFIAEMEATDEEHTG